MFFETNVGDFRYDMVVYIEHIQGNKGREYYNIHLTGGQHVTMLESDTPRAELVAEWKTYNANNHTI